MSLNWKEINCILDEIPLAGSFIRQAYQPDRHSLVLECYKRGSSFKLYFYLTGPHCRLHLVSRKIPNPPRPPRFVSFLRAHLRNGRILSARQIGEERIIKIQVSRTEKQVLLWARLWGGAANMIATDEEGRILDAFYRRANRDEITGGFYNPEAAPISALKTSAPKKTYTVRELPGKGSFNERIERFYFGLEGEREREKLKQTLTRQLEARESRILLNLEQLKKKYEAYSGFARYKSFGDLILSNLHTIKKGDAWLVCVEFLNPDREISIELDPVRPPAENAERYYEKYRKARSGRENLEKEIGEQEKNLAGIKKALESLAAEEDTEKLKNQLLVTSIKKQVRIPEKARPPGLVFYSAGFQILVGRTAKENDELLRKVVKGNDTWFHSRDYPGAYVFIKCIPGKSIPLEVMIEAGNLAIFYSKGKNSGAGDVYYTKVKNLRRAKDGKAGLVIPTQEKNLFIKLDQRSIERLRSSSIE